MTTKDNILLIATIPFIFLANVVVGCFDTPMAKVATLGKVKSLTW